MTEVPFQRLVRVIHTTSVLWAEKSLAFFSGLPPWPSDILGELQIQHKENIWPVVMVSSLLLPTLANDCISPGGDLSYSIYRIKPQYGFSFSNKVVSLGPGVSANLLK